MKVFKCDNCKIKLKEDKAIMLGSKDGNSLCFKNESGSLRVLGNFPDLHFCNKECFVDHFFKPKF